MAFCAERGILLTAYSPVGKHKFADDADIRAIADAHASHTVPVSAAQVLLSWGVQRGTAVIPKTLHGARLKENVEVILSRSLINAHDVLTR